MSLDAIAAARRMKRGEGLGACPHEVIFGLLEIIDRLQADGAVPCALCGAKPGEDCDVPFHTAIEGPR